MPDSLFDIVFTGQLAEGFELAAVKQKVSQLFKLDADKTDRLFLGKPVTLKKNLEKNAAQKYQKILTQIGMNIRLREQQANEPVVPPSDTPVKVSAKVPEKIPVTQAQPEKTKPTPTADEKSGQPTSSQPNVDQSSPAQPLSVGDSAKTLLKDFPPVETWQLDKPGVRLSPLPPKAAAVEPDTALDVTPQQGNILRPDEIPPLVIADIDFSVLDSLKVNEVGEYLIPPSERAPDPIVDIDTSHLSVEPAGGYLLKKEERPDPPKPPLVDFSGLSLEKSNNN